MRHVREFVVSTTIALALSACGLSGTAEEPESGNSENGSEIEGSVAEALRALPDARVISATGGVPRFVEGNLGRIAAKSSDAVEAYLPKLAPVFRVDRSDLKLKKVTEDELGSAHARFSQTKNGLRVVGGDLVVHVDSSGTIYAVNGSARDDSKAAAAPAISANEAALTAKDSRGISNANIATTTLVYLIGSDDNLLRLAYEVEINGEENGEPVHDLVYVDASSKLILETHPQIHHVRNRKVYSYNGTFPGVLKRSEGQAPIGDPLVDKNYDALGATYDYYKLVLGRDSFNAAGAPMVSTVHSGRYDNAYWTWSTNRMTFGDGSSTASIGWGSALDVVGHEFTHGVTQYESNLAYYQQSGGINEAMSDILGESIEAWVHGSRNDNFVDAATFLVAEEVWTPGVVDALRYMDDPARDGKSVDDFSKYNNSLDVHYSSGIANLSWALLVKGGKHPRGLHSNVTVPALGKAKATKIFYRANALYLVSNSGFRDLRNATVRAATDLYGSAAASAVTAAFDAVGAPANPTCPKVANPNVYSASADFSGIQGCRGWSYRDSVGLLTFNIDQNVWTSESGLYLRDTTVSPGPTRDVIRRWTAPAKGNITIVGTAQDLDVKGDGARLYIQKNGVALWSKQIINSTLITFPGALKPVLFSYNIPTLVAAGDVIDFVVNRNINNSYDGTSFNPTITWSP